MVIHATLAIMHRPGPSPASAPLVELRIHGVSGTPPESVLDAPRVRQVAGDEWARVFRAQDDDGREVGTDAHRIEALHWGRLTSGSWTFALWLLLVPFGLVNVAAYMLPRPPAPARAYALACGALRALGALLTTLFALGAGLVLVDLVAGQGAPALEPVPVRLLRPLTVLVAGALVLGFFLLARSGLDDDRQRPGPRQPEPDARRAEAGAASAGGFAEPAFLRFDPDVPALRRLHLAAGLAATAGVGFAEAGGAWRGAALAATLVAFAAVVVTATLGDPGDRTRPWTTSVVPTASRLLVAVTGLGLVAAAVAVAVAAPPADRALVAADLDRACAVLVVLVMVALVLVGLLNGVLAIACRPPANRRFAPFARGMAGSVVAGLGVFVAVGYAGAAVVATARLLTRSAAVPRIVVPEMLSRAVYAWGLTVALALMIALVAGVDLLRRRRGFAARADAAFAASGYPEIPARWTSRIGTAMWAARAKNHVVGVLLSFVVGGVVFSLAAAFEAAAPLVAGRPVGRFWPEWFLLTASEQHPRQGTAFVLAVGTLVLAGVAVGLVLLGRAAVLGASTRRGVNVVWDVIAFWPRAAHPFVPPPYSQAVIPRLDRRIQHHLDGGAAVAVCGHSQGSLIVFATLVRRGSLAGVGLVTFGSQLQVLFARAFPAYVDLDTITGLEARLDRRWRNLYRDTDPLAGPVLSWDHRSAEPQWPGRVDGHPVERRPGCLEYGPEWRLLDPPVPDPALQDHPFAQLRRHGDYWTDPAWPSAVIDVAAPVADAGQV